MGVSARAGWVPPPPWDRDSPSELTTLLAARCRQRCSAQLRLAAAVALVVRRRPHRRRAQRSPLHLLLVLVLVLLQPPSRGKPQRSAAARARLHPP